jgi:hypothetical protein
MNPEKYARFRKIFSLQKTPLPGGKQASCQQKRNEGRGLKIRLENHKDEQQNAKCGSDIIETSNFGEQVLLDLRQFARLLICGIKHPFSQLIRIRPPYFREIFEPFNHFEGIPQFVQSLNQYLPFMDNNTEYRLE